MEPENQPLEKEIPFGNPSFSGSMLIFQGVFLSKRKSLSKIANSIHPWR